MFCVVCWSYRKVIANVCEGGLNKEQSAKQHSCPLLPPKGLQLGIKGQMLAVAPGDDITFIVHQEQVKYMDYLHYLQFYNLIAKMLDNWNDINISDSVC